MFRLSVHKTCLWPYVSICGFCFVGGGDDDDVGSDGVETRMVVTVMPVEIRCPVSFPKQGGRPTKGSAV